MALLNPPEVRPTVIGMIVRYVASRRGQHEPEERLVTTLAPPGLGGADPTRDVRANLTTCLELGVLVRDGDDVRLADGVMKAVQAGDEALVKVIRSRVLHRDLNNTPWGTQVGARDLTNALGWFLTFEPSSAPTDMEGQGRPAKDLQELDFGPRQGTGDDEGGWPIANAWRWGPFRWWAVTLGFAWISPRGHPVPDPTRAIRSVLPDVLGPDKEVPASEFVTRLATELPVLDFGEYRRFVEQNWKRGEPDQQRLTSPLSDALLRLAGSGGLVLDDRADARRVTRYDGTTFSHVRPGRKR